MPYFLKRPAIKTDTVTVYHDDSRRALKAIQTNSVDAIVTDPPFGIGFLYGKEKETTSNPVDYWNWFKPFYEEMFRVLKPGGLMAVWQAQPYLRHVWEWFGDDLHVYAACKNFVQIRPKAPVTYAYDPVVIVYKPGGPALRPAKPRRNMDYFVANTAALVSKPDRLERQHPCPRPLDQVREIVANFSLPQGIVLDPFLGSGTTALAAHQEGRKCIGIEEKEAYIMICKNRINQLEGVSCG